MDSWPQPDPDAKSIAFLLSGVCLPIFILALSAIALRTYVRVKNKTFGQDDMQLLSSVVSTNLKIIIAVIPFSRRESSRLTKAYASYSRFQ